MSSVEHAKGRDTATRKKARKRVSADDAQAAASRSGQSAEVHAVAEKEDTKPKETDWSKVVRSNFDAWSGGDGFISRKEIAAHMQDDEIKGEDAAALAALRGVLDDIEELSNDEFGDENDGLTLADVTAFEKSSSTSDLKKSIAFRFSKGKELIENKPSKLFDQADKEVDWSSVKQHFIGDCYFLAALVSKVEADPDFVNSILTPNKDGTYTVDFPGKPKTTVTGPTESEIATAASADGLWIVVLEKAYGQVRSDDDEDRYEEIDGDPLKEGINTLSTNGTDTDTLTFTGKGTTREKLEKALGAKKIVTASVMSDNDLEIPKHHAYTVLRFDKEKDDVTVRNPWGHGEPGSKGKGRESDKTEDGVFVVSIKEFDDIFSDVCYEE